MKKLFTKPSATIFNIALLVLLGACASSGGGEGDAASVGGADGGELESLAASIGSDTGPEGGASESEMQMTENDVLSQELNSGSSGSDGELSLDDSSSTAVAADDGLNLDDTMAAAEPASSSGGGGWSSGAGLAINAGNTHSMPLMDTAWLEEATESTLGFSCRWKTLKQSGKVRHRICSIDKQVVVNLLEKNRGGGYQLAKIIFDQKGKAAYNRWKNSIKSAAYRGGKSKTRGSKTFARYMSSDHRSFVDLVWNDNANAATLIMTPTAKGLGRELKKVAGY